jgi:hypothetical protein
MRRTIQLATATLFLALSFTLATPAQTVNAHAGATLYHANDTGYAADIVILCGNGTWGVWNNGNSQNTGCTGTISKVYVNAGTQIVCYLSGLGWRVTWDATGWHNFGGSNQWCVYQLD